jgi:hypothetical protein
MLSFILLYMWIINNREISPAIAIAVFILDYVLLLLFLLMTRFDISRLI